MKPERLIRFSQESNGGSYTIIKKYQKSLQRSFELWINGDNGATLLSLKEIYNSKNDFSFVYTNKSHQRLMTAFYFR